MGEPSSPLRVNELLITGVTPLLVCCLVGVDLLGGGSL